MKTCTKCRASKPLEDFHRHRGTKDGRFCYCKSCTNQYARDYKKRNYSPEQKRKWWLSNRYGLTPAEADKMMTDQKGLCGICSNPMKRVCIDHDHSTGLVRGLLCHKCNIKLPAVEDASFRADADRYLAIHLLRCAS